MNDFLENCKKNKMIPISESDLTKIKYASGDQGKEMWEILNRNTYYWLKDEDENVYNQQRCKYVYFQDVSRRLVVTRVSLCGVSLPFFGFCKAKCY